MAGVESISNSTLQGGRDLAAKLSDLFCEDLTTVRVEVSPLPGRLGTSAFAMGERVFLSPSLCGDPFTLEWALAHEMAHVVQARRTPFSRTDSTPHMIMDADLEAEAEEASRRAVQGLPISIRQTIPQSLGSPCSIMQPLIINVGRHSFSTEFRKTNGWIVAKDVYTAMAHSGNFNDGIIELNQCAGVNVGTNENIYLQGHGFAGGLGGNLHIGLVARELNKLTFPPNYAGEIRIYCCSAGASNNRGLVPYTSLESSIKQLRMQLRVGGIRISGAAGIALNSPDYPNGTRVIAEGTTAHNNVFQQINNTRGPIDTAWNTYVANNLSGGGTITAILLRGAAQQAFQFCRQFYQQLSIACARDLKPIGTDIAVGTSIHGGRPKAAEV